MVIKTGMDTGTIKCLFPYYLLITYSFHFCIQNLTFLRFLLLLKHILKDSPSSCLCITVAFSNQIYLKRFLKSLCD